MRLGVAIPSEHGRVSVTVRGVREVTRRLRDAGGAWRWALAGALYREAERVKTAAQLECPVDTGRLRSSASAQPPVLRRGALEARVGFNTTYALRQHEGHYRHRVGKRRYLADPLLRAASGLAARVAADARELVRGLA